VECNQSENPVQRKRQTVENHEKTYRASHADLLRLVTLSFPGGEGRVNLVGKGGRGVGVGNLPSLQNIEISRACETKLGCVLAFLENAINMMKT